MKQGNSQLNYRITGNGYPVIFLHGFLESSTMWENLLPSLNGMKCITIDLYGHGQSPELKTKASLAHFAQGVLEVIQREEIKQFGIVGHSFGGYLALALQNYLEPSQCEKIILLNSHPWADSDIKKEERTKVIEVVKSTKSLFLKTAIPHLFRSPEDHTQRVHSLIEEAMQMSEEAISAATIAMRDRPDQENLLKELNNQSLIIQGKYDNLIPYEKIVQFADENKVAFLVLEDAGHMSHLEATTQVIDAIKDFILN